MSRRHAPSRHRALAVLTVSVLLAGCATPGAPRPTSGTVSAQQLDATFGQAGVVTTDLRAYGAPTAGSALQTVVMADGRLVVLAYAGQVSDFSTVIAVLRYLPDGSLDPGFGTGGVRTVTGEIDQPHLAVGSDGRVVLAWANTESRVQLTRLLTDGTTDATFGAQGMVYDERNVFRPQDVLVQPDGRIVVIVQGPYGFQPLAVRYDNAGLPDPTFGSGGNVTVGREIGGTRLRADALGRLWVGGSGTYYYPDNSPPSALGTVVRLLPDGQRDPAWTSDGFTLATSGQSMVGGYITALDVQADGRPVIAGKDGDVARFDAQGTPDWTFGGGDGQVLLTPGQQVTDVVARRNGKLLLLVDDRRLLQLNPDGSTDATFGTQGTLALDFNATRLTVQGNGQQIVSGGAAGGVTLERLTPTDGDAPVPPPATPALPPLTEPLTVTTSSQSGSTSGDPVTVPVGSTPVVETTLTSGTAPAGQLGALSLAAGSPLTGAEVYLDGVGWQPMTAVDGTFDSPAEAVRATLPALTQAGTRTVCVRAVVDVDRGAAGCAPLKVGETLKFGGFVQPVVGLPTVNTMKAGAAVPVKFSLGGNFGLDVLASGSPRSATVACEATSPVDPVEQTVTAGSSGLQYDAASGLYTYVWKTDKTWAGTCRQFTLTFRDTTTVSARFRFSK